jgi:hypothetical protein
MRQITRQPIEERASTVTQSTTVDTGPILEKIKDATQPKASIL